MTSIKVKPEIVYATVEVDIPNKLGLFPDDALNGGRRQSIYRSAVINHEEQENEFDEKKLELAEEENKPKEYLQNLLLEATENLNGQNATMRELVGIKVGLEFMKE